MWHDIKNIFHFIIIFQCIIFIIFLFSEKNRRQWSNAIFMALLISIILTEFGGIAAHFLALRDLVYIYIPHFYYIIFPFRYLYTPFLLLYALSLIQSRFQWRKLYYLHFMPFLIIFLIIFFRYLIPDSDLLRSFLQKGVLFKQPEIQLHRLVEGIQYLCYSIALLLILKNYEKRIKNYFSTIEKVNLSWLKFIVYGFIFWKSLLLINSFLRNNLQTFPVYVYYLLYIFAEAVFLIFLSLMFLKGLKQSRVFFGDNGNFSNHKYRNLMLSETKIKQYKTKLLRYMEMEKPYLNPSISLQELARELAIPAHHLSFLLNVELKLHFYDFINSYRLKESKRLLSEKTANNKTVLEILYETGFNSKSVFNTVFKKHTGMTPTQFRNFSKSS